jgi:TonB family protein
MRRKSFWLRVISFAFALMFGLLTASVFQKENFANKNQENVKPLNEIIYSGEGTGVGSGCAKKSSGTSITDKTLITSHWEIEPLQIISKPRANYTDAARQNQVQGTVALRVVFTASGQIGSVSPVKSLSDGLTEQAIAAAKEIKFEPAKKNGVPQTVTKQVQYSFTIY